MIARLAIFSIFLWPAGWSEVRAQGEDEDVLSSREPGWVGKVALHLLEADSDELVRAWNLVSQDPRRYGPLVEPLFARWIELDPQEAIERTQHSAEWWLISPAWYHWAREDPTKALAAAKAHSSAAEKQVHDELARIEFAKAIEASPQSAMLQARANFQSEDRALVKWIQVDPVAAVTWFQKNRFGRNSPSIDRVVGLAVTYHPNRLNDLAAALPTGRLKRALRTQEAQLLAKRNLPGVLEMARAERSPLLRREFFAAAGTVLSKKHPAESIALLREYLSGLAKPAINQVRTNQGLRSVTDYDSYSYGWHGWIKGLVEEEPERTMIILYGVAPRKERLAYGCAQLWMKSDRNGFERWLKRQPVSEKRDPLVLLLVDELATGLAANQAAAIPWIMSISNRPRRKRALNSLVERWAECDRRSAAEFFNSDAAPPGAFDLLDWQTERTLNFKKR